MCIISPSREAHHLSFMDLAEDHYKSYYIVKFCFNLGREANGDVCVCEVDHFWENTDVHIK